MRFFQRLAPSARAQHAVQPVLPPRFAGVDPQLQEPETETLAQPARSTTMPEAQVLRPSPAAPNAIGQEGVQMVPNTHARETVPSRTRAESSAVQPIPHDAPRPVSNMPTPPRDAAPVRRAMHVRQPAIVPALETAPCSLPQRDAPAASFPPQRPLSTVALAQRVQVTRNDTTTSDTTVVHVTIDRIDVRAPAPAQAQRAQAKPRHTPTTSLADYLRRGRP